MNGSIICTCFLVNTISIFFAIYIHVSTGYISNLRYADDTTLMAESEKELKSLLMKVKERVKKLA